MDYLWEVKNSGELYKVNRNGGDASLYGNLKTYSRITDCYTIACADNGKRIMDVFSEQIEFTEWHKAKGGKYFSKPSFNTKFNSENLYTPPITLQRFGLDK